MIKTMINTNFTPLTIGDLTKWFDLNYFELGLFFGLDKDLSVVDLNTYMSAESIPYFRVLSLVYVVYTVSVYVLFMEESSTMPLDTQTTYNKDTGERKSKPTIDIVFSKVSLDKEMFFIYNKNDNQGEDTFSSLLHIRTGSLKRAEIEINGKLQRGILRNSLIDNNRNGYYVRVKPTVYRTMVETHNLESNGRNVICRAGKIIIYEDN